MGYSRTPGPLMESPFIISASPSAPVTGLGLPGAVGMKGGDACSGTPRMKNWPRAIEWGEFRDLEERPEGEDEDAQIDAQAILDPKVNVCSESGKLRLGSFTVKLTVFKANSWVVRTKKSDDLRSHEQGHYDLLGLDTRVLIKRLAALRADSADELQRLVNEEIEASKVRAQALSDLYDAKTEHGLKATEQGAWKAAIQVAISTDKEFQPPSWASLRSILLPVSGASQASLPEGVAEIGSLGGIVEDLVHELRRRVLIVAKGGLELTGKIA